MRGAALDLPPLAPAPATPAPAATARWVGVLPRGARRDRLFDLAAIVLALLGGLSLLGERIAAPDASTGLLPPGADLVVGLVATAALAWRRRSPVVVATALGVTSTLATSAGAAAAIALWTLAANRPLRAVLPVAALHAALVAPYVALHPDDRVQPLVETTFALVVIGAVVAWGMLVRARRQLVVSLRERAERAEAEQQLRVEQARDHERARIAREMHDVLAHRLSLVSLHAGALEFRAQGSAAAPHEVARAAAVVRAGAHEALEDLRTVVGMLREDDDAPAARPQPGLADVPALVAESRAAGVRVHADVAVGGADAVPAATGRAAYRIVQEGLTNARKHAPGCVVELAVAGAPGGALTVRIANGRPAGGDGPEGAIPGTGAGLVGLAERAALAGGTLRHGPTAGGGFALEAQLPWPV